MFESAVVEIGDRLAGIVDGLDPDAVPGPAAAELWAALDRVERLAAAGKTLLARPADPGPPARPRRRPVGGRGAGPPRRHHRRRRPRRAGHLDPAARTASGRRRGPQREAVTGAGRGRERRGCCQPGY
jgi:hypothetical protein